MLIHLKSLVFHAVLPFIINLTEILYISFNFFTIEQDRIKNSFFKIL